MAGLRDEDGSQVLFGLRAFPFMASQGPDFAVARYWSVGQVLCGKRVMANWACKGSRRNEANLRPSGRREDSGIRHSVPYTLGQVKEQKFAGTMTLKEVNSVFSSSGPSLAITRG
jgi:hypothetical protein